jgi:hypothetical protein
MVVTLKSHITSHQSGSIKSGLKLKISLKKDRGQLIPYSDEDYRKLQKMADGAIYTVDMKNMDLRSLQQNRALHKLFELIATALNDRGLTVTKTIKADIIWTPASTKELLWRPIQQAALMKRSTAELSRDEIDKVYDVINLALGQRFGIHVPFPTIEK